MDVGVHLPSFTWPGGTEHVGDTLGRIATSTEKAGCHSLSVMDHYFQMEAYFPVGQPMLEGYTTLGYVAAHTSRVKLRTLVTGVTYRHPGLLAKIVATLDVLSHGRAELGIGAAWYEREHKGLGVPFPPLGERFERLQETLEIVIQMWSDDDGPYRGRHYELLETICSPRPLSRPRPRILIGGGGEKKTLRLVAKYGDACNLYTRSVEEVRRKLEVLREHCVEEGRDYDVIRKTILYTGEAFASGDVDRFVEEMGAYASLGVAEVIVMPIGEGVVKLVETLGTEIVPRLARL